MKPSKQQRKQLKEQRKLRKNKRSVNAGEYETGRTVDRKKTKIQR